VDAPRAVDGVYDPVRIVQLIENLVENAVKYTPEGGPVQVKIWREGGYNNLTVTDSGIGIPTEDLPHIFERFHRGTNVDDRRFAGMGLGLFICRGIAEQHGGRIWATRAPGGGSTFHVALPVAAPQDGPGQEAAPTPAALVGAAPRAGTGQGGSTHD
jgi:signal transduction histidine kinase